MIMMMIIIINKKQPVRSEFVHFFFFYFHLVSRNDLDRSERRTRRVTTARRSIPDTKPDESGLDVIETPPMAAPVDRVTPATGVTQGRLHWTTRL